MHITGIQGNSHITQAKYHSLQTVTLEDMVIVQTPLQPAGGDMTMGHGNVSHGKGCTSVQKQPSLSSQMQMTTWIQKVTCHPEPPHVQTLYLPTCVPMKPQAKPTEDECNCNTILHNAAAWPVLAGHWASLKGLCFVLRGHSKCRIWV